MRSSAILSICGQAMEKFSGMLHGILWLEFQRINDPEKSTNQFFENFYWQQLWQVIQVNWVEYWNMEDNMQFIRKSFEKIVHTAQAHCSRLLM